MVIGAFFKNESVEHAVDQIAQRPRKNQSRTDNISVVIVFLNERPDIIDTENNRSQPEQREEHFSEISAKLPSPGHALILHKEQLEFFAEDMDAAFIRRNRQPIIRIPCLLYTSPSPRDRQKSR